VSVRAVIELRASVPPAGSVVLVNDGPEPVRVLRRGNEWGDEAVSFELERGGRTTRVVRAPQLHTRNVPSSVSVPAGGRHEVPFDLGDGTWETGEAELLDEVGSIVAEYRVEPSPLIVANDIWTGRLRSDPVPLGGER